MLLNALLPLLPLLASIPARAATADQWRSRSIYQIVTDRFAPSSPGAPCSTDDRRYCGGNWQSLIGKLDYIQGMGYDAVWISPTGMNIEGQTPYGEAYHGYWITDPTRTNPHFGSADDLKALSAALHAKGMYLMVDIAINALCSTSDDMSAQGLETKEGGQLYFKKPEHYHKKCGIAWGNRDSEQKCWLATSDVYLMDLDQDNADVGNGLKDWVKGYVQEFGIDGMRLDATKHMAKQYQNEFCKAAGVFCVGEVYGNEVAYAASYQGPDGIDSVFGFTAMYSWKDSFTGGSPRSMATHAQVLERATSTYPDPSLIGAFLDNQDLPRFSSFEGDKQRVYNAIVGTFLYGGIPSIYYGLEQDIADGVADPHNREALWLYNNFSTDTPTYQRIKTLNQIRSALGKDSNWLGAMGKPVATQQTDFAMNRQGTLVVLTNRGSGATGTWAVKDSGFVNGASVIDLLSCRAATAGSDGSLTVTWTNGEPFVFVSSDVAAANGLCGATAGDLNSSSSSAAPSSSASESMTARDTTSAESTSAGVTSAGITSADITGTASDTEAATASNTDTDALIVSTTTEAVQSGSSTISRASQHTDTAGSNSGGDNSDVGSGDNGDSNGGGEGGEDGDAGNGDSSPSGGLGGGNIAGAAGRLEVSSLVFVVGLLMGVVLI